MDINFERLSPKPEDERLPLAIEITNHVKGTGTENLIVHNVEDDVDMQILDFDFTANFNIIRPVDIREGQIENDGFFKGMVDFKDTYI
ncbi:MAG: hypothetical protein MJ200_04915 [Mycoplasmoidaceae bacterium]|nr:hypothetical protein [Mycoplasmoidaceae bacterium]